MGTAERRNNIMRMLCRRRYETITNLASEFGVSERTIRRDIDVLSATEPIYTQTGRYGGGVYFMEQYSLGRIYMTEKELGLLQKLCSIVQKQDEVVLSTQEIEMLTHIISDYSKPQNNTRKEGKL